MEAVQYQVTFLENINHHCLFSSLFILLSSSEIGGHTVSNYEHIFIDFFFGLVKALKKVLSFLNMFLFLLYLLSICLPS